MTKSKTTICICKALILSYLLTAILIFLYALALWKLDLSENVLKGAVIILYIVSSLIGGIYIGKVKKERKYLWGLLTGCLYFLVLFVLTVLSEGFSGQFGIRFLTTLLICGMSGTLGGMLA